MDYFSYTSMIHHVLFFYILLITVLLVMIDMLYITVFLCPRFSTWFSCFLFNVENIQRNHVSSGKDNHSGCSLILTSYNMFGWYSILPTANGWFFSWTLCTFTRSQLSACHLWLLSQTWSHVFAKKLSACFLQST